MGHALALCLWAFGLLNLLYAYPGIWATIASWLLGGLVAAHAAETAFVWRKLRQSPEPFWPNLLKSFVFGYFHVRHYL
ncbi:DUF1145 domain-containing protein [Sedimentitalea arenosa]|uniref:DUF1145 domain-containing protein n=1 Tax=Sedimentitalea arenosa TaxID=2798803 RepID=A0A8J7JJ32_9RHOB|nr:DUF1145 domain-containing protein [Arenibacterium arenosum]MBJ6373129.1 DUF1145 domain-containing protein [Arenibacterium arenosum]